MTVAQKALATANRVSRSPGPQSLSLRFRHQRKKQDNMNSRPQVIMTIKDRHTTIFECTVIGCKWSRIAALGTQIIAEGEALKHLKTHDEQAE